MCLPLPCDDGSQRSLARSTWFVSFCPAYRSSFSPALPYQPKPSSEPREYLSLEPVGIMPASKVFRENTMLLQSTERYEGTRANHCRRRNLVMSNAAWDTSVVSHTPGIECSERSSDAWRRASNEHIGGRLDFESLAETIAAMKRQEEASYICQDYLALRKSRQHHADGRICPLSPCGVNEELGPPPAADTFTASCRRKMCVWSFHVVDHFGLPREVVSVAFAILDGFLSRCDCDITVFKLAAMTCLFIASKMSSSRVHLVPSILAAVSRDEFEEFHFRGMETVILETMEWRVNPPTAGAFVDELARLVPVEDVGAREAIGRRARHLAELSVLDYSLVPERASSVALACVLNAVGGLQTAGLPPRVERAMRRGFLREADTCAGTDYVGRKASYDSLQEKLWRLYVEAENGGPEQYHSPEIGEGEDSCSDQPLYRNVSDDVSPVSVSTESAIEQAKPW